MNPPTDGSMDHAMGAVTVEVLEDSDLAAEADSGNVQSLLSGGRSQTWSRRWSYQLNVVTSTQSGLWIQDPGQVLDVALSEVAKGLRRW